MSSRMAAKKGDHATGTQKPAIIPIRLGRWIVLKLELEVLVSIIREMEKNHHFDLQLYMIIFDITRRYQYHDTAQDLDKDRKLCRDAIQLYPTVHPLFTAMLGNLAAITSSWLFALGERVETADLGESIAVISQVLLLNSRSLTITNRLNMNAILGRSHNLRFDRLGDTNDLKSAIKYFEHVLELCPASKTVDRAVGHYDLAVALKSRPKDATYLDPIIHNLRQCHTLLPPDHHRRLQASVILCECLDLGLEGTAGFMETDDVIEMLKVPLTQFPAGDPHRFLLYLQYGRRSLAAYKENLSRSHLDAAYEYLTQAHALTSLGYPDHNADLLSSALGELANTLRSRYEHAGDMADLDDAIAYYREAARMPTSSNVTRSTALCELSNSLCYRCGILEDKDDLQEAFEHAVEALRLTDREHPNFAGILSTMVVQYQIALHHQQDVDAVWMDQAIQLARAALQACPESGKERSAPLSNLAKSLLMRGVPRGSIEDLNEAIGCLKQVVEYNPAIGLFGLGGALLDRGVLLNDKRDMDDAIATLQKADKILSGYHSLQGRIAGELARAYEMRGNPDDIETEIAYFSRAANHPSTVSSERLSLAKSWAHVARKRKHNSSITAYATSLSLLERYVMNSHTIEAQRRRLVTEFQTLPLNATSCAISEGSLEVAVELLEQGRAVLWSQVGRYRTSLERLSAANPQLAAEFRSISAQLEKNAVSSTVTIADRDASAYRLLLKQWNVLLEAIRKEEGFSDFLRATPFSVLRNAAIGGPVVIINVDEYSSDAIIVHYALPPTSIPLPHAIPRELTSLARDRFAALRLEGDQATEKAKDAIITRVLRRLWDIVVEPIVGKLRLHFALPEGSRVWWCPTSVLWSLPVHAAGPYKKGAKNLADIFVSSYTPTLSALIRSINIPKVNSNNAPPKILLVGQAQAPGQAALPAVTEEVRQVEECVPSVRLLNGEHATRDAVLLGLQQCSWIHLACHGSQDLIRPFQSHFILHDRPLPLLDIIQTGLPDAEFAFLSACHSAAGDMQIPNEVIHLAAGLQFSGFGGVVATMWAMADDDGPFVAKEFYKYMFRNPGMADYRDAAVALNLATKALRRMKVPIHRWINFIHIGA